MDEDPLAVLERLKNKRRGAAPAVQPAARDSFGFGVTSNGGFGEGMGGMNAWLDTAPSANPFTSTGFGGTTSFGNSTSGGFGFPPSRSDAWGGGDSLFDLTPAFPLPFPAQPHQPSSIGFPEPSPFGIHNASSSARSRTPQSSSTRPDNTETSSVASLRRDLPRLQLPDDNHATPSTTSHAMPHPNDKRSGVTDDPMDGSTAQKQNGNGHSGKSTDDDEFGDDLSWIETAAAAATRIEATFSPPPQETIQPPPRNTTASPYFVNNNGAAKKPSAARPPSRLNTSSPAIRFPKLPSRTNTASPVPVLPSRTASRDTRSRSGTAGTARVNGNTDNELVSIYALDTAEERNIFRFDKFNKMQSAIFQAAYNSDDNLVVSAPTGSGKTTVFELAFLKMHKENTLSHKPLAIYMAPTKALCNERVQDWKNRLASIDVQCIELTGDTEMTGPAFRHLEQADLVVTTPEKWDSVTRRSSMGQIVERLSLMLIDEVHILHEARGATLEVVVSRMKTRGANVRFVAVSASVPNIDDVARWIGSSQMGSVIPEDGDDAIARMPMARVFKFGEDFRPVQLKRVTYGYEGGNEFSLGSKLDKELFPILLRHSAGLPILVFAPTRKACQMTADHMCKEYKAAIDARRPVPWDIANYKEELVLKDSKLQALADCGIAVHHAGIDLLDRRKIEDAFKRSRLHLIVATSTLAVGVNLPAHLVVIKGTSMWQGQNGFQDYSDIDIQQMMGRAGRPQYDTSGTVVIMCQNSKKRKFQDMLHSRTNLESCLHEHLTEHINSEIGLQTITSLKTAQEWLRNSFLWIRIQQNPKHYISKLVKDHSKTWTETLDRYVENALNALEQHDFVAYEETDDPESQALKEGLHPTSCGKIMSQSFIAYATMRNIINMDPDSSLVDLLEILAGASEFSSLRIRQGEGAILNKLRTSDEIRFPIQDNVKTFADKVFLHLQVTFGNVSMDKYVTKTENASPLQTQVAIFNSAPRIARAILLVASEKRYGQATRSALELVRTINGKAWEDSPTIFRQIDRIGPKSITVLGSNGISTWEDLIKVEVDRLGMWLNRNATFGHEVIEAAKALPRFTLVFSEEDIDEDEDGFPVLRLRVKILNSGSLTRTVKTRPQRGRAPKEQVLSYNFTALFLSSRHNRFLDLRRIDTKKLNDRCREFLLEVTLYDTEENIIAVAGIDEKAGVSRTFEYKPKIDPSLFPKPGTKPIPEPPTPLHADASADATWQKASGLKGKSPNATNAKSNGKQVKSEASSSNAVPGKPEKEPLFLPRSPEPEEIFSSDDELIDLTSKPQKRSQPSAPRRRPKDKRKRPRLAVSKFIDDEAEEDDDEEEDGDSFDEFEQYFIEKTPKSSRSPSPPPKAKPSAPRASTAPKVSTAPKMSPAPKWLTAPRSPPAQGMNLSARAARSTTSTPKPIVGFGAAKSRASVERRFGPVTGTSGTLDGTSEQKEVPMLPKETGVRDMKPEIAAATRPASPAPADDFFDWIDELVGDRGE